MSIEDAKKSNHEDDDPMVTELGKPFGDDGRSISAGAAESPWLQRTMAMAGAHLAPGEFVEVVNKAYYKHKAASYQKSHVAILDQCRLVWNHVLSKVSDLGEGSQGIKVLDLGCGTGFAADQVVGFFGADRIREVVLFDTSTEMLQLAVSNLKDVGVKVVACLSLDTLVAEHSDFDLVVENSVLHHLPDPYATIRRISGLVSTGGRLVLAQEPNSRFHEGTVGALNLVARRGLRVVRSRKRSAEDVAEDPVIKELLKDRVIEEPLAKEDVQLIVDFWVPRPWHSERRFEHLGLNPDRVVEALPGFQLKCLFTYQHLGMPASQLSKLSRMADWTLRSLYPEEGQQMAMALAR